MALRRRDELLWEFDRWGYDERGWAPSTRRKYIERSAAPMNGSPRIEPAPSLSLGSPT